MMNKAMIVGYLGQDPELKYTESGSAVTNLRVATTRRYKDRDGNQVEQTEWHNVVAWGRTAEVANEYLAKGSMVIVEGRLQTRQWEDRDGNDRYTTEINASNIQFGPSSVSRGEKAAAATESDDDFTPDDELPF